VAIYPCLTSPSDDILLQREVEVKTLADVAVIMEEGNSRRAVAAHNMNEFSSRSHAVLQARHCLFPSCPC